MAEKPKFPKVLLQFFKETGAQGGKTRADRYSKEQLSEWGKKGGRPKGRLSKTKKGDR